MTSRNYMSTLGIPPDSVFCLLALYVFLRPLAAPVTSLHATISHDNFYSLAIHTSKNSNKT